MQHAYFHLCQYANNSGPVEQVWQTQQLLDHVNVDSTALRVYDNVVADMFR